MSDKTVTVDDLNEIINNLKCCGNCMHRLYGMLDWSKSECELGKQTRTYESCTQHTNDNLTQVQRKIFEES